MEQHPLAAKRKSAGLTMESLGERLGVTRQAVSSWENGESIPGGPARRLLALTLGVPLVTVDSWFEQPAPLAAAGGSR